ncbi:MAG TPA: folylpolyglutamate synthase/dihydrofolate synthase family protein [Chitinophagaceae bacterium]|nr:folylpolyglutamate synthase/dihydrofolate synthase family protein [Chitinophagaceae bacterium]
MTYGQTIHYLYNKLPLYSKIGIRAYKADLSNTLALCTFLGEPQKKIKTIHIAGTNGKGSTSHMLAAIFQQHGYKTGLYTSPHLQDFRERIKINGEMITKKFVIHFVERLKSYSEKIHPSFFELTFVMALQYFAEQQVDIAIIETGLGGRLDSTNVITPELSVITNIGFDHMDILGNTLDKIAFEKAGIIKKNISAVIGETTGETRKVFISKASETGSRIFFAEELFQIVKIKFNDRSLGIGLKNNLDGEIDDYLLDLNGIYQQKNLRTVMAAVNILKKTFSLNDKKIKAALSQVKKLTGLHGRWEAIHTHPLVVLDVAHNADGIQQVMRQTGIIKHNRLRIIFGMVKDKDPQLVLPLLPGHAIYYFTQAHIPRALPGNELMEKAAAFDLHGKSYENVNEALKSALAASSENDLIIVCGSVFVIGEVDKEVLNVEA